MIHESKTSPAGDAPSTADGAGRLPAESPEPAQASCSACGARLHVGARFCGECGTTQAPPAADRTEAIRSQFGGSSDDLAQLLSARGQVVACPSCDELNSATAAYCGHCGQRLKAPTTEAHAEPRQARIPAAALRSVLPARRYGPAIALALLAVATLALWPGQAPTTPAGSAAQAAPSRSVPTAPAESAWSAAEAAVPEAAPEAGPEEQQKPSPPVSPPAAEQPREPHERAHKKVAKAAARRASAQPGIDEIYRQRAAERCAEGLHGLVCRETVRFALCDGKWTQEARSGMEICRLNP